MSAAMAHDRLCSADVSGPAAVLRSRMAGRAAVVHFAGSAVHRNETIGGAACAPSALKQDAADA